MKDLSIIIPSRNELPQLLFTIQGVMDEFEGSGVDYEILAVLNLCSNHDHDVIQKFLWPIRNGILRILRFDSVGSCWLARRHGVAESSGRHLLFLDSHVLPHTGSYLGAYNYAKCFNGALHLGMNTFLNHPSAIGYQYIWVPEKFWGEWSIKKPEPPYHQILGSGFAGTLYSRAVWDAIGGLNPNFRTYGGAELYLDLKTWMFGFEVRCHPDFWLRHLAIKRGYNWSNNDAWFNTMLAAYIVAGPEAARLTHGRFQSLCDGQKQYLDKLDDLFHEAITLGSDERAHVVRQARYTAEEILDRPFVLRK